MNTHKHRKIYLCPSVFIRGLIKSQNETLPNADHMKLNKKPNQAKAGWVSLKGDYLANEKF